MCTSIYINSLTEGNKPNSYSQGVGRGFFYFPVYTGKVSTLCPGVYSYWVVKNEWEKALHVASRKSSCLPATVIVIPPSSSDRSDSPNFSVKLVLNNFEVIGPLWESTRSYRLSSEKNAQTKTILHPISEQTSILPSPPRGLPPRQDLP